MFSKPRAQEKKLEPDLVKGSKARGWWAVKLTVFQLRGFPDRLVLMPKGRVAFAEIKTEGKKPDAYQRFVHKQLRRLGFDVWVIDCEIILKAFFEHYDLET